MVTVMLRYEFSFPFFGVTQLIITGDRRNGVDLLGDLSLA